MDQDGVKDRDAPNNDVIHESKDMDSKDDKNEIITTVPDQQPGA